MRLDDDAVVCLVFKNAEKEKEVGRLAHCVWKWPNRSYPIGTSWFGPLDWVGDFETQWVVVGGQIELEEEQKVACFIISLLLGI